MAAAIFAGIMGIGLAAMKGYFAEKGTPKSARKWHFFSQPGIFLPRNLSLIFGAVSPNNLQYLSKCSAGQLGTILADQNSYHLSSVPHLRSSLHDFGNLKCSQITGSTPTRKLNIEIPMFKTLR